MRILIAGAGPSGSRLARKLSKNGINVILVDSLNSPHKNAFSSAVVPSEVLSKFSIPSSVISANWNSWQLIDPYSKIFDWEAKCNLGSILDFGKLREFLWKEAQLSGVDLLLGWKVISVTSFDSYAEVLLKDPHGFQYKRSVDWLVDATGSNRRFIGKPHESINSDYDPLLKGVGLEFLIRTNETEFRKWVKKITFFLGSEWIPHGYGWVFPMSDFCLKVGVCMLPPNKCGKIPPLSFFLNKLLLKTKLSSFEVIDKHGGVLSSTISRSEAHVKQRVIGVGDAVSTANLLGGEGIRHAFKSADVLAEILAKSLTVDSPTSAMKDAKIAYLYSEELKRELGWRWNLSGRIAKKTYWQLSKDRSDRRISKLIRGLEKKMSAEDISALLFDYRFERYGFRLLPYLMGWK